MQDEGKTHRMELAMHKDNKMKIGNTQYCKLSEYVESALDDISVQDNTAVSCYP